MMKNVLLVEPSSSGTALIGACLEMGLRPIVLTAQQDDRILPEALLALAAAVIVADTTRDDEVIEAVLQFDRQTPLSAVVPGFEYFVPLAARIAARLGLKGLDPTKVDNVRLKNRMRNTVCDSGLRSPSFAEVETVAAGIEAAAYVTFPMVVKPIGWSGSLFVRKVDNLEELDDSLRAIFSASFSEYGISPPKVAILEEYLSGKEYSIEGYVFEERIQVVSVTQTFLGCEPHFIEVGHITPAPVTVAEREKIASYVAAVVKALDISVGPFHCEIRNDAAGPVLIEIGARLAGDNICELIAHATGIDLCKVAIAAFMDDRALLNRYASPSRAQFSGIRYFIRPGLEQYDLASGIDDMAKLPGYRRAAIQIGRAEPIPPATSSLGRLGYCICTGTYYEQLITTLDHADRCMVFA
ncbi:MAG: ATP-grasp domain-containing protein [Acidobacteriales bacterium]|nr:ATP-grasp domain-containing protein [Terriglobales bacterium]